MCRVTAVCVRACVRVTKQVALTWTFHLCVSVCVYVWELIGLCQSAGADGPLYGWVVCTARQQTTELNWCCFSLYIVVTHATLSVCLSVCVCVCMRLFCYFCCCDVSTLICCRLLLVAVSYVCMFVWLLLTSYWVIEGMINRTCHSVTLAAQCVAKFSKIEVVVMCT